MIGLVACLAAGCAAPTSARPAPKPWYVTVPALNLRRCPGVECSRLAVLDRNEVVLRLREDGEWVEVRVVRTGQRGWVASRFLEDGPVAGPQKRGGRVGPGALRPTPEGTFKEEFLE